MDTRQPAKLNLRGIGWFLVIAYGLAWLLDLPMYLDGKGLNSPWASLILLRNFTPAIATFIVTRWLSPVPHLRQATGLRLGVKGSRWGLYYLFGWLGLIAFAIAAPFVAALFGLYPLDLVNFSGLRALQESAPGGQQLLAIGPIQVVVLVGFLTTLVYALTITPFNFGEEWGWRGYLLPQLLPLGQWRALLISGAIWGFWHAPLSLLGFTYPQHPVLGVLLYVILGVIFGIILGWTRLATGSVWPAVLGHAGVDGSTGAIFVFAQAGFLIDTAVLGLSGWTGWIVPLLFIAFLALTRRLPVRNSLDQAALAAPALPTRAGMSKASA